MNNVVEFPKDKIKMEPEISGALVQLGKLVMMADHASFNCHESSDEMITDKGEVSVQMLHALKHSAQYAGSLFKRLGDKCEEILKEVEKCL